jgi:hypothetical protein
VKIFCPELNKEFSTQQEMFIALVQNKTRIIGLKKAAIKESDPVGFALRQSKDETSKSLQAPAELKFGDIIYPVINTTNFLDSHKDMHLDGIWDLSIKDQQGKTYYTTEHKLDMNSIISYPDEVEILLRSLDWSDLGQNYVGKTQALIFASMVTELSNKKAFKIIKAGKPLQGSIRMQYVDMDLCVNSTGKGMEAEYMNYMKYFPLMANKEDETEGYFWAQKQAKIVKEGSAVLAGSNRATPIYYNDPAEAGQKHETEPPADSSTEVKSDYFYQL